MKKTSTTVARSRKAATPQTGSAPPAGRSTQRVPEHDVVGALYAEHRYAARLLDLLEEQQGALSRGQPLDREALIGAMTYMTQHSDAYHHPREDAMFAALAKRDPHLVKRIAEVERAHRTIGTAGKQLLAALQRLPQGSRVEQAGLASRIGEYVSRLREHMAIEERDLFPRASQVLDDRDLAAVDRAFRRVTDPIFEATLRDAYAAYSPVVRYLVEQPALRQAADVLDRFFASASTLEEFLLGWRAQRPPEVQKPSRGAGARKVAR